MSTIWALLPVLGYIITLLLVPGILLRRREPTATTAWILGIILLPLLGGFLYLVFGTTRIERRARRKQEANIAIGARLPELTRYQVLTGDEDTLSAFPDLYTLATRMSGTMPTRGNHVEVMTDTNRAYGLQYQAILNARNHVHLACYIYQRDATGRKFRDLLIEKSRQGVHVRVLLDAVGSMKANRRFLRPMIEAGVQVARFMPVNLLKRRWTFNLRNHRKILVVDGRLGFAGGMNIGDEYVGRDTRLGYWRDTHIRLRGPSALQLQQVFAEDWFFATGDELTAPELYPAPEEPGDQLVHIVASGPDRPEEVLHHVFFAAINAARQRLLLQTSYFVPSEALRVALTAAAQRGVEVSLMLPGRSAHPFVLRAAQSYYDSLLVAGVTIYEYTGGLMHSKVLSIDGQWSLVGSPNFDNRSLRLNFEVAAVFYSRRIAQTLEDMFRTDLERAARLDLETWQKRSLRKKIAESACRLLSPIL